MLLVPHRALFLLALLVLGPPVRCPAPDFSRTCARLAPEALPFPLPVFRVPLVDDDCPILAVFVEQTGPEAAELHVVTADEDHPLPVIDQLYDAQRWFGLVEPTRTDPGPPRRSAFPAPTAATRAGTSCSPATSRRPSRGSTSTWTMAGPCST